MIKPLSKSKLIAYRQCAKRLWFEVHHPELRKDHSVTQASFDIGHTVGKVAQSIYDPKDEGQLLDLQTIGMKGLLDWTQTLLAQRRPIFEAGFGTSKALSLADVLLPVSGSLENAWRMIEVKSSTKVKPYHRDDAAIQFHVARESGLNLQAIAVAVIDTTWVYLGGAQYSGLLVEEDLTKEAISREEEVKRWIEEAHAVIARDTEPMQDLGSHCQEPFACGFIAHCSATQPRSLHPVEWIPRAQKKRLKEHLAKSDTFSMADIPNHLLNERQRRVKECTLSGQIYIDIEGASKILQSYGWPARFVDFETIGSAVPIWAGTRPYEAIPFQFSLHCLTTGGHLSHCEFLDTSGHDPTEGFARALVEACGQDGPLFVYNKSFEGGRLNALAIRHPKMAPELADLHTRLVDLKPIAENHYYHPSQQGSWSIKAVLPAIAPELDYGHLKGPQNGTDAQVSFVEAINPATSPAQRETLRQGLLAYCRLDTYAMVRLWQILANRVDLNLVDTI